MVSAADIYQAIFKDASEHPIEVILKVWGVISGAIVGGWGIVKLIYATRKAKRLNARDLLTFLELQPVLYDDRDTEAPEKIYGAAQRIRSHMEKIITTTQNELDREDVKSICLACSAFTNNKAAFPGGMPPPALGLTNQQWDALRLLRNKVVPPALSIAGRYCLRKPTTLETWESYVAGGTARPVNTSSLGTFLEGSFVQVTWHPNKRNGQTEYGTVTQAYPSSRLDSNKTSVSVVFTNSQTGKEEIASDDLDTINVINSLPHQPQGVTF
jgi:hypothetical protein